MVVWGLMLNGDDKSVWPGPVSPGCIFTVSQGIAATVTAHQAGEIEIEKGTVRGGEGKTGCLFSYFTFELFFSAQRKLKRFTSL